MSTDPEPASLISDLLVRAGILMEDFSVECVSTLATSPSRRRCNVRRIGFAGIAIGALTAAAWALMEAEIALSDE